MIVEYYRNMAKDKRRRLSTLQYETAASDAGSDRRSTTIKHTTTTTAMGQLAADEDGSLMALLLGLVAAVTGACLILAMLLVIAVVVSNRRSCLQRLSPTVGDDDDLEKASGKLPAQRCRCYSLLGGVGLQHVQQPADIQHVNAACVHDCSSSAGNGIGTSVM